MPVFRLDGLPQICGNVRRQTISTGGGKNAFFKTAQASSISRDLDDLFHAVFIKHAEFQPNGVIQPDSDRGGRFVDKDVRRLNRRGRLNRFRLDDGRGRVYGLDFRRFYRFRGNSRFLCRVFRSCHIFILRNKTRAKSRDFKRILPFSFWSVYTLNRVYSARRPPWTRLHRGGNRSSRKCWS